MENKPKDELELNELITMPMLALRGLVLFPQMVLHFEVGREKSVSALNESMKTGQQIFLVAQKDIKIDNPTVNDLYKVGVVAEVRQILKSQGNTLRVLVAGTYRAQLIEMVDSGKHLQAVIQKFPLKIPKIKRTALVDALMRTVKELFEEYCFLTPKMPRDMVVNSLSTDDPVYLCEYITANIPLEVEEKQRILEESAPSKRLELLAGILENENSILGLERDIYDKVKEQIDQNQREYFLREQMKIISDELGESDSPAEEADDYYKKISALKLDMECEKKLIQEADRLSRLPSGTQEAAVLRTYLDTCLELPWNTVTKEKTDLVRAEKILNADHYGLTKVKERILELVAVRSLAPDIKGQIICLVGPPGVGKTSIAKSVARALGRRYTRVSLGGVRDESDIRGHRKTYVGAMPGRIITAIKLAGSKNPILLLDEIDKLGNDFRGDPSSELLEVLDSEQNSAFRDHYIELPFDLSAVLFITTANDRDAIPAPLLDRMEVVELNSYTREEKFNIAKKYLVPKQTKRHGLGTKTIKIADDALYALTDNYTREAGVRNLERTIASLCRKAAKKIVAGEKSKINITNQNITDFLGVRKYKPEMIEQINEIGLVNGLAWTSVGGEMLQVEVAILDGTGKIELTGQLGDVMKESAHAAISYIRSRAASFNIEPDFYKNKDIHIHIPEGAIPKDGPSAGVTMCTAVISALSGIAVRCDVAMTGEITLRGRVLPIGGLKEKTMAAYRAGVKIVIIPADNEPDIAELDPVVTNNIKFVPAKQIDTVLKTALVSSCENQKKAPVLPVVKQAEHAVITQ
ncbi:MAG: endopeptidase La [Hydrogenoanaerobacterium sp.]